MLRLIFVVEQHVNGVQAQLTTIFLQFNFYLNFSFEECEFSRKDIHCSINVVLNSLMSIAKKNLLDYFLINNSYKRELLNVLLILYGMFKKRNPVSGYWWLWSLCTKAQLWASAPMKYTQYFSLVQMDWKIHWWKCISLVKWTGQCSNEMYKNHQ